MSNIIKSLRSYQSLLQNQLRDFEGRMTHTGRSVNETVQNGFQIELDDGAGHARRDVIHLFQIFIFRRFRPLLVFFDHSNLFLLKIDIQNVFKTDFLIGFCGAYLQIRFDVVEHLDLETQRHVRIH